MVFSSYKIEQEHMLYFAIGVCEIEQSIVFSYSHGNWAEQGQGRFRFPHPDNTFHN